MVQAAKLMSLKDILEDLRYWRRLVRTLGEEKNAFVVWDVPPDGNCFFYVASTQLFGRPNFSRMLRCLVTRFLEVERNLEEAVILLRSTSHSQLRTSGSELANEIENTKNETMKRSNTTVWLDYLKKFRETDMMAEDVHVASVAIMFGCIIKVAFIGNRESDKLYWTTLVPNNMDSVSGSYLLTIHFSVYLQRTSDRSVEITAARSKTHYGLCLQKGETLEKLNQHFTLANRTMLSRAVMQATDGHEVKITEMILQPRIDQLESEMEKLTCPKVTETPESKQPSRVALTPLQAFKRRSQLRPIYARMLTAEMASLFSFKFQSFVEAHAAVTMIARCLSFVQFG